MDPLTAGFSNGVGVVAVVLMFGGFLFRLLATGALLTRREGDSIRADRDHWRETAATEAQVITTQAQQITQLIEHTRLTQDMFRAAEKAKSNEVNS